MMQKTEVTFTPTIEGLDLAWPIVPAKDLSAMDSKKYGLLQCPGVYDAATAGYLLRAWTDIKISSSEAGVTVQLEDELLEVTNSVNKVGDFDPTSSPFPYGEAAPNIKKINLPWLVTTPKNYSCLMVQPMYHFHAEIPFMRVYAGVLDTDEMHKAALVFSVLQSGDFIIQRGTPLLQIIPFQRESYVAKITQISIASWNAQRLKMSKAIKHYYWKALHRKKSYR